MSTSYDRRPGLPTPEIEAFVYQDIVGGPGGAATPTEPRPEPQGAKTSQADNVPRISEEEISRLVSEARAEGMAEGVRQAEARLRDDVAKERERIAGAIRDFQRQRTEYYSKVEIELVHLALAIAGKILHRESQIDRMVVAGLVKAMLERLHQNTKVVVHVRPEDAESWRHFLRDHEGLQVVEDPGLQPKDCLLETELGIANMGLDAKLKEVEQGFFDLLARRPEVR